MSNRELDDVVRAYRVADGSGEAVVDSDRVRMWMRAQDLEVLAALYALLSDPVNAARIKPPLERSKIFEFACDYLFRCIKEDPVSSDWASSRYLAAYDLQRLFKTLWQERDISWSEILRIERGLRQLYELGDSGVRDAVIRDVLEHLFEQAPIRAFFDPWKTSPILAGAIEAAEEWVDE